MNWLFISQPKPISLLLKKMPQPTTNYRSGTVNSNTVNSKFHLIRSYCEIFFYNFPNIPCLKYTVNSNFRLIQSKTLPTNDFELTVPDLYIYYRGKSFCPEAVCCIVSALTGKKSKKKRAKRTDLHSFPKFSEELVCVSKSVAKR